MSFPLPVQKYIYQYSKVRFLEREHGIEYHPFELKQIKKFGEARKKELVELTGFVSWVKPPTFLLLPSRTTPNCYIICEAENELKYPSLNQFVTIKGKWSHSVLNKSIEKILLVEYIQPSDPDFGKIKPHISSAEFEKILFEKWRNIGETTQKLIAQRMISSPTIINERAGGITLTLANYSKKNSLRNFVSDLNRFIPKEFTSGKPLSFKVPELRIKNSLPPIGYHDHVVNLDNIPKLIDAKLDRIPATDDEYSITVLENTMGPINFDARGLAKSDYPIILEQHIEKRYNVYDVSTDVYKYLMSTQMCAPVVSLDVYNKSLEQNREELGKFITIHEKLSRTCGTDQFMDLGRRGKPLSIHNLAVSIERGKASDHVSLDDVIKTSKFYFENLDYVMDVWEDLAYDKISPAATMTNDERQVYVYFVDHPKCSKNEVATNMNIPLKDVEKIIQSLFTKHLLYEIGNGMYSAVPIDV